MKVLVGGCFNKIHPGHVYFLKKAKELGYLIVVLAHDKNNKKPYAIPAKERKKRLQKLGIADKIVIGDPEMKMTTLWKEMPDIVVLGYDQKLPDDFVQKLKKNKIKISRIKKLGSYSSKNL